MNRGFEPQEIADQVRDRNDRPAKQSLFRFLHVPKNASQEQFHELVAAMLDEVPVA